jgi:hypothetical protein
MRNQLILPAAAMLSLAGAALGVHLGNASIAEINPVHYASHETSARFHADLTPQGYRGDWAAIQASEYRAAQAGADLGAGCVGCRTYPEEVIPVYEASLGKPQTGWFEVAQEVAPPHPPAQPAVVRVEQVEPTEQVERDPALEQVERYAGFPVNEEQRQEKVQQLAEAAPYAELGWSAFD